MAIDTSELTYDDFVDVLDAVVERGWVSKLTCATHEGVPSTDWEDDEWERGADPCQPVLRIWGPGGRGSGDPQEDDRDD